MSFIQLLIVPILACISGLALYRYQGKGELLRMDIIQFLYAFVLAPVVFIWIKSVVFILLNSEGMGTTQLFVFDTVFSTAALYVYAFVVMHSLTKSIHLLNHKDPLYDLFEHTEYYHLWLTHILMYIGLMVLFTGIAVVNVFQPLILDLSRTGFWFVLGLGAVIGSVAFLAVWLSDPQQAKNFMRLMKLAFGFFFLLHAILYFVFSPPFTAAYVVYWWSSVVFMTLVMLSAFVYKSSKAQQYIEWLSTHFKHKKWGINIQLFD